MSKHTQQVQTGIGVDGGLLPVLDLETASDEVYDALSSKRRRQVLSVLIQDPMPISVKDLARQVALRERTSTTEPVTEEEITRVHASLYHQHLPKLESYDLIIYDAEEQTVEGITDTNPSIRV